MAGRFTKRAVLCTFIFLFSTTTFAFDDAENQARFIFQRLNGKILKSGTPIYNQMVDLVRKGQTKDAALLATKEAGFVGSSVRHWAAQMLTKDADPSILLSDSLALLMGSVRDNLDARLILTGNYIYAADPRLNFGRPTPYSSELYTRLETQYRELDRVLYGMSPQWDLAAAREVAGIFTTRYWAQMNYNAGTNRHAVTNAFESFLCLPQDKWKRPNLPTTRIRQDIDRFPLGDARTFQTECRTCHSSMDGFAGAFAKIDFRANRVEWDVAVTPKYFNHADQYPDGFVTKDSSFVNYLYDDPQNIFGWGPMMQGQGIAEFAKMMSDSRVFADCMVKRTIRTICRSEVALTNSWVQEVSAQMRTNGYKLKDLFVNVVTHPKCKEMFVENASAFDFGGY